jgi:cytochrome c oxidase assembly protein subunit 15
MVLATLVVGGATRLTDSGLSITEWQPLIGAIPPLGETAWQEAFRKYQEIPEYRLVNRGMSLAEFKIIYWWEWAHRFLARAIGVVFLLPFLGFWLSRSLPSRLVRPLAVVFVLGALQGAMGWYMVKSGLTDRVDVSQYRLAAHLALASLLLSAIVWIALGISSPPRRIADAPSWRALLLIMLTFLQIAIGGFMAGMDAGLVAASFPDMNGRLVPDGLFVISPWWRNLFENALTVHFAHRLVGWLIAILVLLHAVLVYRRSAPSAVVTSSMVLLVIVIFQFLIGVATVMTAVPMPLALVHQAVAQLLLIAAVVHLHMAVSMELRTQSFEAAVRGARAG